MFDSNRTSGMETSVPYSYRSATRGSTTDGYRFARTIQRGTLTAPTDQKIYFSANCITRLPLLLVTVPNEPLVGFELAPPQFG